MEKWWIEKYLCNRRSRMYGSLSREKTTDSSLTWPPSCRARNVFTIWWCNHDKWCGYLFVSMTQLALFTAVVNWWPEGTMPCKLGFNWRRPAWQCFKIDNCYRLMRMGWAPIVKLEIDNRKAGKPRWSKTKKNLHPDNRSILSFSRLYIAGAVPKTFI